MADKKEIQKHQARRGNCMTDGKKKGGGGGGSQVPKMSGQTLCLCLVTQYGYIRVRHIL